MEFLLTTHLGDIWGCQQSTQWQRDHQKFQMKIGIHYHLLTRWLMTLMFILLDFRNRQSKVFILILHLESSKLNIIVRKRRVRFFIYENFAVFRYRGRGCCLPGCHLFFLLQFWSERAEILHIDYTSKCSKMNRGDSWNLVGSWVTGSGSKSFVLGCAKFLVLGLGQPSLVWVWVWKFPLKIPNFSLPVRKNLFGLGQKVPGSKPDQPLIYCESKVWSDQGPSLVLQIACRMMA